MEYKLLKKIDNMENDIKLLKKIVLSSYGYTMKKPVSFRGIAKTKLSDEELDQAIEESQRSLLKGM